MPQGTQGILYCAREVAPGRGRLPSLGTVLVVDDEESVGRIISAYFRRWRIEQVYTPGQGFERYGEILDLRMAFVDLDLPDSRAHSTWSRPTTTRT